MLASQLAYTTTMAQGKSNEMTEAAKRNDGAHHARLNKLRARPENAACFDCTALRPGWAVLPHGIFVCIDCAQLHRSLGRHISQTKAVNTGTYLWYEHEMKVMEDVGNAVAGRAFGAHNQPKPSRDASPATKLAYVKAKYDSPDLRPDFVQARAAFKPEEASPQTKAQITAAPLQTFNRVASSVKPGLKGALRTSVGDLEPPRAMRATPMPDPVDASGPTCAAELDLIRFDEPAILPPKPGPSAADGDFFAAFGL